MSASVAAGSATGGVAGTGGLALGIGVAICLGGESMVDIPLVPNGPKLEGVPTGGVPATGGVPIPEIGVFPLSNHAW
mgnify:CR=1 FL=1